jgi:O-antigen/teichoic acid export membrane protein
MVWSLVARVGRYGLGVVSSVIVVRSLGDHDYGVLSLVRTLMMLAVMLCSAGLGQAVLKFLPMLRVAGAAREARRLVRKVLFVHGVAWAVLLAACWLGRGWIGSIFGYDGFDTLVAAAVALALFEVFFTGVSQVLNASYDTRTLSIATLTAQVVYIAGLVVVLPRGGAVLGVLGAAAAGQLVAGLIVLRRLAPAVTLEAREASEDGDRGIGDGRLFRYAAPFALVGILNLVVWRQSETILLGYFRTAAETGYFDLAYRMSQLILEFVPGTVWPLVMAGVSEVYARNPGNLRVAIDRYYRMLFILCAPLCIAGMVLGGRMITILFGETMAPAAVPTQVFFGIFSVSFFGTPLSMSLYVMEKTHVNLVVYLCLAVVNVGLDLLLIPRYGVAGAMVPVGIVIFVSPFVYRAVVARYVEGVAIPLRFIAKCFLASSPVVLLVPLLPFVSGVVELCAAVLAAGLLVVGSFKLARVVGPTERELLGSIPVPGADRLLKFMSS